MSDPNEAALIREKAREAQEQVSVVLGLLADV
jgi:hypothetical protein